MTRSIVLSFLLIAVPASAGAQDPFVVLRDEDGVLATTRIRARADLDRVAASVLRGYDASGAPMPEVMSVWTSFGLGGARGGTLYAPYGNDVRGIGLESAYGGDGTFASERPPLRGMLLHNDFTYVPQVARVHGAEPDGYARYLFLLELSHVWGPAAELGTAPPEALLGFGFHWSFWLDGGGSPAGGNVWRDNGDGTFTAERLRPGEIVFSPLDLYLMGLAPASEVPPFGVLVPTAVPADITDPFWGGDISARSFPWMAAAEMTVTATRRTLTVDDVIAGLGARAPAFGEAQTSFTLGIVLVVPADATDGAVEGFRASFAPIAESLAPAFAEATGGRGTLRS